MHQKIKGRIKGLFLEESKKIVKKSKFIKLQTYKLSSLSITLTDFTRNAYKRIIYTV